MFFIWTRHFLVLSIHNKNPNKGWFMARNSPERLFFFFPPNARFKAYFLILNVWWDFVCHVPLHWEYGLKRASFCEDPQVDLSLRTGLSFALSSPASFYLTKWRHEVSRACQYSSRKQQLWNSFISKGSCFHFFGEYIDYLFSYEFNNWFIRILGKCSPAF